MVDDLKAYRDDQGEFALMGALGGGAAMGGAGIYDLLRKYKEAQGPLLDDGNVLSLRGRKPSLGKYAIQNPKIMKEVLSKGMHGAVKGAGKGTLAGGLFGMLLPYLWHGE